jgi:uncharacterized protein (DUF2062 family)
MTLQYLRERLKAALNPRKLRKHRILRPIRPWLRHRALWTLERDGVARGVAIGLFFGILIPIAQILFAALLAIALRANLAVAAAATLVTNPLTFPFVYYAAYRIGSMLLTGRAPSPEEVALLEQAADQLPSATGWFSSLMSWTSSVGLSLALGLMVLALLSSAAGYVLVQLGWRLRTMWAGSAKA